MLNEHDIQRQALEALGKELEIAVTLEEAPDKASKLSFGGLVHLKTPFNQTFLIETIRCNNKPASLIAQAIQQCGKDVVLATDYISEPKGKALRQHGIEFFDMSGNIYLNRPGWHVWVIGKKLANGERSGSANIGAAFERSGLKVTFALMTQPKLIQLPYRAIAEAAGVALGTVKRVLDSLEQSRHLNSTQKQRYLQVDKTLIDRWAQAYISKLLPKLRLGEFVSEFSVSSQSLKDFHGSACMGGEVAADFYSGILKSKLKTLYVEEEILPELMAKYRLKRSNEFNTYSNSETVQVVTKFWMGNEKSVIYAHPLVVYADLLASNNPRNTEAAEVIYERHLESLCR